MDLKTAKELDCVLNKLRPYGGYVSAQSFEKCNLSWGFEDYVKELKDHGLIKWDSERSGPNEKSTGYHLITFKGKVFPGFENQIKDSETTARQAEENRKQLLVLTVLATFGTFGTVVCQMLDMLKVSTKNSVVILSVLFAPLVFFLAREAIKKIFP